MTDGDVVVTTVSGAKRLGGNAHGLAPWATTRLEAPGRPPIDFRQSREVIEREFARAPEDIRRRIRFLPIGVAGDRGVSAVG